MTATKTARRGQGLGGTHRATASTGSDSSQGQKPGEAPSMTALAGLDTDRNRPMRESQPRPVPVGTDSPAAEAMPQAHTGEDALRLLDPHLTLIADLVTDIEHLRIAVQHRLGHATRVEADKDGEERGLGLPDDHPTVLVLTRQLAALKTQEHEAVLALARTVRKHPLGPWLKATQGCGEKQAPRLLAAINDPYWNDLHNRPRTVSELWAYCGLKPGQRHTKGQRSNWSSVAKSRAWLIANNAIKYTGKVEASGRIKARSPYRDVYEKRRAHTAVTHPEWSDGHSHNDALRVVSKEFLKDLWIESRRLHLASPV